ncbi:MAG TPA: hypothetical protein VD710_03275 [Nitrososphaeraceae archaeon]|nr:hypothetical protein [Nitrososphaeraceae archaeon]
MSVLLKVPTAKTNLITKSKYGESKTSSILLISAAISIALILVVFVGMTYTDGMTGGEKYSTCRDKIIGFEQHGMYGSPEQFKLALSYCSGQ